MAERIPERCYCGDPWCGRCFPYRLDSEDDDDPQDHSTDTPFSDEEMGEGDESPPTGEQVE